MTTRSAADDLARRIRYWSEIRKLTQVQLAGRVGVGATTVNAWLRGRAFPSYLTLMRLTRALDTTPGTFFGSLPD